MLIAPKAALPDPSVIWVIPIALIPPFFYGLEGNFVAKFVSGKNSPMEVIFGASVIGCIITFPLTLLFDQFVNPFVQWNAAHYAIIFSSMIHGFVYASYVWLVTKVGSVFSAQVSYFVTFAGVLWSMVILNEVHSQFIWLSLACMILGMVLVRPKTY
jgi:drug/metabolite transporter (DMT)-like permease